MKQIGVAMEKLAKKISSVLWRKQTCFDGSYIYHTGSCIIIVLYMIIYYIYNAQYEVTIGKCFESS